MVWKIVGNADSGDAQHHGGDSTDKISQLFSGIDVDDVDINADWKIRSSKFKIMNPANSFGYLWVGGTLTGSDKQIILPVLAGNDSPAFLTVANAFTNSNSFDNFLDQKVISAPANPAASYLRLYPKTVDANNEGLFVKEKVNGAVVEVQYA